MKKQVLLFFALFLGCSVPVLAQGVRFDIPPILTSTGKPVSSPVISLCSGTATISGASCSPATALGYTDITTASSCPIGSPVVLTTLNTCQATGDNLGNAGFWLKPGTYIYCITGSGITGACYNLTVPIGAFSSGAPNIAGSVYCTTSLNAAVTAVSGAGSVIIPLGASCPVTANLVVPSVVTLVFLSPSLISIPNAVTLTINGPIVAPLGGQLFFYSGSGTVALGAPQEDISAAWFPGADWAAQYNNADTALGSNSGTIRLPNSMTSTTAATVFHPSNNRHIIFDCGTWLTNVATRAFNLNSNAVTLEGCANGGTLGIGTMFDNKNATSITLDIGDTTGGAGAVRGLVFSRFTVNQDQSAGVNVRLRSNLGNVSFSDIFLEGSVPGSVCMDGTDGNYVLITIKDVRATSCKNFAYNFNASLATGNVEFIATYASGTTGSPGTGYNLANGLYNLYGTAADGGVNGYDISSVVTMSGTEDEGNSGAGIRCLGSATVSLTNHESNLNGGNPVFLSAAGCQINIDNLKTISTSGSNSILVGSSATAECHIRGTAGLDKAVTFQAGGNCEVQTTTAPTISSGFGTTPSIVNALGPQSFEVNVGTGGTATSGVIGLPAVAANGWTCLATDLNTNIVTRETAFTATTVTFTAASAWTASDKLMIQCRPF